MSRILPLEKDVNLDKRYINESETITENALENVINGGGGDKLFVRSTADWSTIPMQETIYQTKAEACAVAGITESEWDSIINGEVFGLAVRSRIGQEWTTSVYIGVHSVFDSGLKSCTWFMTDGSEGVFGISESPDGYGVHGLSKGTV